MVIDTSALLAILFDEPERDAFLSKLDGGVKCFISAVSLVEAGIVITKAKRPGLERRLEDFLEVFQIEVVAFDQKQSLIAREAFEMFGKGRHRARLNFGDCITYALAKLTREPLLYKGNDFNQTDLPIA